jgi:hypothetical protein
MEKTCQIKETGRILILEVFSTNIIPLVGGPVVETPTLVSI